MRASLFISLVLFSLAAHAQEVPPPTAVPQNIAQVQSALTQRQLQNMGAVSTSPLLASFNRTPIQNELIQRQLQRAGAVPPQQAISSSSLDQQRQQEQSASSLPDQQRVGEAAPVPPLPYKAPSASRPPRLSATADRLSNKTEFGQFAPHTAAETELETMLRGKDKDIDLALANWLIAADTPQFSDMTREEYFAQLDAMTDQVRKEMARMQGVALSRGEDVNAPSVRCATFCNAIIKLGFGYADEFSDENLSLDQMKELYSNANNIFLAGLLRTRRGTCVSMPLLYLVIGQRLGMPVHLVAIGKHYFVRWEEPGYRMNIEATLVDRSYVTPDDSAYLESEGKTLNQLKGYELRNLTRREVVGNLFFNRSGHLDTQNLPQATQQCLDLSRAEHLAPGDPAIKATHERVYKYYGIKPEHTSIEIVIKPKDTSLEFINTPKQ